MAYTVEDRLVAYGWFVRGLSADKIKAKMRRQYPGLKAATIRTWTTKYGWEKQRERHVQQALDAIGASAMDEQLKAAAELQTLIDDLKASIDATEIKSHEGAVYALLRTIELRLKLLSAHPSQQPKGGGANPFLIADQLLTILAKHPALRGPIRKNKAAILAQLKAEMPQLEAST